MAADALIGVDWGGSRIRAFRYASDGTVAETRERDCRLTSLKAVEFEEVLAELTLGWRDRGLARFILCGMVGSRQGWAEAAYVACPADAADIAAHMLDVPTRLGVAQIAPGLSFEAAERADVMRGEETQILGAIAPGWSGVALTPGTHSKWALLEGGRIIGFRTWMTGELFALLGSQSLLGRLMADGPHDAEAFALGVLRALEDSAITALLFSVRAEALLARIAPTSLASYLSGLLIGAEVAGGLVAMEVDTPILIISAQELGALYAHALDLAGRAGCASFDGDKAAARGLWRLDRIAVARRAA